MHGGGASLDPAANEAQGALRDAVSAAQNLLVLLGSLRVAPRTISPVLAEIRRSVEVTPDALATLLRHLALHQDPAALGLSSFLLRCASDTSRALLAAESAPVEARSRLALEASFRRLVPRLDAVRELAELLTFHNAPRAELDLAELLEASFSPASRSGLLGPSLQLCVEAPLRGAHLVRTHPRSALRLLCLVLGHTHGGPDHGWSTPHASLRTRPLDGRADCLFGPRAATQGDIVVARVPLAIPPTAPVLALFCGLTGTRLLLEDTSPRARLSFPPA